MEIEKFTFGNTAIAVVVGDMASRNPLLRKHAQRINDKYATLSHSVSLGIEWKFFGALLRRHFKEQVERSFTGVEKSHLLNFLASKSRQFEKHVTSVEKRKHERANQKTH